jgi:hypothetical protein
MRVDVRGIDEVDTFVEGGEDHFTGFLELHATAEVVGTKANNANFKARVSKMSIFHVFGSLVPVGWIFASM